MPWRSMASWRSPIPTDQGWQFTGSAFTGVLADRGIAISMDGKAALSIISSDATPKDGLEHVSDDLGVTVPSFDVHGNGDGVASWELLSQSSFERVGIICGHEPVKVFRPVGFVAVLVVLVETPVRSTDEPGNPGTTESFLPPPYVSSVAFGREASRQDFAVRWDHAHAHNFVSVRVVFKKLSHRLGHESLSCVAAFRASRGEAALGSRASSYF
jgi:hypothetical protein